MSPSRRDNLTPEEKPSLRKTRLAIYKGMGGFGTLGIEIILSVLFGVFVGNWLDGKLETSPWFTLAGLVFGAGAAVRAILRALKLMHREAAREEREQGNPGPIFETSADRSTRLREADKQREVRHSDTAATDERADERHGND